MRVLNLTLFSLIFFCCVKPALAEDWRALLTQALQDLKQGSLDKAEDEFRNAEKLIEGAKITGGKDELKTNGIALVDCLVGVAKVKDRKGDFTGSEEMYGMALETLKKFVENGWKNQQYADYLPGIIDLYERHGKTDDAENAIKRMIEVRTTVAPIDDSKTISAYELYSKFLRAHSRSEEATSYETKITQMKYNQQ